MIEEYCIRQLTEIGIDVKKENGTVYVCVGDVELELAPYEIEYRAKLYCEENNIEYELH